MAKPLTVEVLREELKTLTRSFEATLNLKFQESIDRKLSDLGDRMEEFVRTEFSLQAFEKEKRSSTLSAPSVDFRMFKIDEDGNGAAPGDSSQEGRKRPSSLKRFRASTGDDANRLTSKGNDSVASDGEPRVKLMTGRTTSSLSEGEQTERVREKIALRRTSFYMDKSKKAVVPPPKTRRSNLEQPSRNTITPLLAEAMEEDRQFRPSINAWQSPDDLAKPNGYVSLGGPNRIMENEATEFSEEEADDLLCGISPPVLLTMPFMMPRRETSRTSFKAAELFMVSNDEEEELQRKEKAERLRKREGRTSRDAGDSDVDLEDEEDYSFSETRKASMLRSRSSQSEGAEAPESEPQGWLSEFIQSDAFDLLVGLFIVLNAASTGYQVDYQAREWTLEIPFGFDYLNHLFSFIFAFELALRALIYRTTFLMYVWRNTIDTIIIIVQFSLEVHSCLDTYFYGTLASNHTPNWLAVLRVIRLMRLIRIIQISFILSLVGELRMLVASIFDSMRSCFWSLTLMLAIMFTFAVFITVLVTHFKMEHRDAVLNSEEAILSVHFGTLDRTMLSLYKASMDGMHWEDIMDPLLEYCGPWHALLVIAYMTFTLLVLMNIVTSVFVTAAMKHADDDKKQVLMLQMCSFFRECDDDMSGSISWEEFQNHLQHPQLLQFLREIDLHPEHARALFRLLDVEEKGDVDIDDIVGGCLRLHGPATSIDLSTFMREHDRAWQMWGEHAEFVQGSINTLINMLNTIQYAISHPAPA
jgi:hypothetical protein